MSIIFTWRLLFNRLFASTRQGVTEQLDEFIMVFDSSSATRAASSRTKFCGNTVIQSNVALRRNFIILVHIDMSLVLLKRCSKLIPAGFPSLFVKKSWSLSSSNKGSGSASRLRVFSTQVELLVQVLQVKWARKLIVSYSWVMARLLCTKKHNVVKK